jgi:hypothetical protein
MPRSEPAVSAAAARLRRLQARLDQLSVPALLRVREVLEPLLERERISVRDVNAVLRAASDG